MKINTALKSSLDDNQEIPEESHPLLKLVSRKSALLSNEELANSLYPLKSELVLRNSLRSCSIDTLLELLSDETPQVRKNAAVALGELGPKARKSVGALIASLHDSEQTVRYSAALALGQIGAHADRSLPALVAAMALDDSVYPESLTAAACISIATIATHKPNSVLRILWRESTSSSKHLRLAACLCLFQIGIQNSRIILPSLHRCEQSRVSALRQNAAIIRKCLEDYRRDTN